MTKKKPFFQKTESKLATTTEASSSKVRLTRSVHIMIVKGVAGIMVLEWGRRISPPNRSQCGWVVDACQCWGNQ